MSVTLRKVTEGDLEQIMRWRMDPEITRYMNTDPSLHWKDRRNGSPKCSRIRM